MKKLLIILLVLPFINYSQLSYKDIMSIDSKKMFKKVMIENGYEFSEDNGERLVYGYEIERDSISGDKSSKWGYYFNDDKFVFIISRNSLLGDFFGVDEDRSENEYDVIVEKIKKNCVYYDVISRENEIGNFDFVCYSCKDSKYKGKIGFMISDGFGYIGNFINEE